ncbi:EAL domain-containing protein [Marinobacteraceae bacterium S3BR75-40.1]
MVLAAWRSRSLWARCVVYFLATFLLLGVAFLAYDYQDFSAQRESDRHAETVRLSLAAKALTSDLQRALVDVRMLAYNPDLQRFLQNSGRLNQNRLETNFLNLAQTSGLYDQVRLLDKHGKERIRVNYSNGRATLVPKAELQEKEGRYYFSETIGLPEGGIYLSPLDLNIEHGQIERPYKPIIRLAMPVFRPRAEQPAGIVILNYRADRLLASLEDVMTDSWGEAMLLNRDGYWLYSPRKSDEWGFMWGNNRTFFNRFPEAAAAVMAGGGGDVVTGAGAFVYTSLTLQELVGVSARSSGDENRWVIVTHVSPDDYAFSLAKSFWGKPLGLSLLAGLAVLLSVPLAWLRHVNVLKDRALAYSERSLAEAQEVARLGSWRWVQPTGQLEASAVAYDILGLKPAPTARFRRRDFYRYVVEEDRASVKAAVEQAVREGGRFEVDHRIRRPDGETRYVHMRGNVIDPTIQNLTLFGTIQDITERKATEQKLQQAAVVFDATQDAILITGPDKKVTAVNEAFTRITGYTADEVIGRTPRFQNSGLQDEAFYAKIWSALDQEGHWQGEIWNRRKNGELYPAWENINVVKDASGEASKYIAVFSDISQLKEAEAKLKQLAHHDPLTGLPNRLFFNGHLEKSLQRAKRHGKKVGLMFLDLDRFKVINDTMGHEAGDCLLQAIGERLRQSVRAEDMVARLGGDEFTIILEEVERGEDLAHLAAKIVEEVGRPVAISGRDVTTSTSIGISLYPDDAKTGDGLAKAADAAMYSAKSRGRNNYQFFTQELTLKARNQLEIENQLRQALQENRFMLAFQPQVDLRTGRLVGLEALLRINDPVHGVHLPKELIPIAEESGWITQVGGWVLQEVCRQLNAWREKGLGPVRISINASECEISRGHLAEWVQQAIDSGCVEPEMLELEITEGVFQSVSESVRILEKVKQMGVSIAIDDFGTGYSSLGRLKHLPVSTLKIDRQFVKHLETDPDSQAIVVAVITLGHSLGLKVIAEGVEKVGQCMLLRKLGCDEVQGFLIGKPVLNDELHEFLREGWQVSWLSDLPPLDSPRPGGDDKSSNISPS